MQPRTGSCLCGGVTYSISGEVADVLHCHCENCRRLTGNCIAASRAQTADIEIEDESTLRWYELGYAKYGFCSNCGSTLFFVAEDTPERTSVSVGTFDDASDLSLAGVWFTDDAQAHNLPLPAGVPHHEGNA